MKRSLLSFAAALFVLCAASGCVTSTLKMTPAEPGRLSRSGKPVAYSLVGMNSGVYLFYYIPLWTGNPNYPNQRDYDIFRDRVDDKAIYRMFDGANRRRRTGGVEDVSITSHSSGVWTLWIFWKRSVYGRGVLVSKPGRKKDAPPPEAPTAR